MRLLPLEVLALRDRFLKTVREFFQDRGFLEIETPLLVNSGTTEPFLDNLELQNPLNRAPSFLITSPETNLKITLSEVRRPIFQIAHVWRAKDSSPLHTQEFLLLEWYSPGMDEFALMDQVGDLIRFTAGRVGALPGGARLPGEGEKIPILSIADLMREHAECTFDRASLETAALRFNLASETAIKKDRYDELFFRVFLDRVEPRLHRSTPLFVHGYPSELAAYSRVEKGIGRRFELLWMGVELANGYYEVLDPEEQQRRNNEENAIRSSMGKPGRTPDPELCRALRRGMPEASGVALGLERLLMVLSGAGRIEEVSPFQ